MRIFRYCSAQTLNDLVRLCWHDRILYGGHYHIGKVMDNGENGVEASVIMDLPGTGCRKSQKNDTWAASDHRQQSPVR